MNAASFYVKPAGGPRPRAPPVVSDDSVLSLIIFVMVCDILTFELKILQNNFTA